MTKDTPMSKHGEFTEKEESTFESGGKYSTPKHREEEAKESDFLMPSERKYPYKVGGKISCNLLKAAMSRSKQHGEMEVHKKAKGMFMDHCE